MSGLKEGESKLMFQTVEKKAEFVNEIADKITETDKNAQDNSAVVEGSDVKDPDSKKVFAPDSDDEIPPLVEAPAVSEAGQMKHFMSTTIKPSLDVENESTGSQIYESGKDSSDENYTIAEASNIDSCEATDYVLEPFDEVDIHMPMINITVSEGKYKYVSLSSTEKVFVPKNAINEDELSEVSKLVNEKMSEMPKINTKISEREMQYPSLSITEKFFVPKNSADEPIRTPPTTSDFKTTNADENNDLSEIPELVNVKMSEKLMMMNVEVSERKSQNPSLSSTEKVFVQENMDEPMHLTPSPAADLNNKNGDEDSDMSDLPELVPLNIPVKSPTQLKIDFFRELEGASVRCEPAPPMSPRNLFSKSKSLSPLQKPSLKETAPEKAVTESEYHVVPVLKSSAACGSDTVSNKPVEPENQVCPKCEGQVTKTLEGEEEIIKCIPKSKYLYCIGISGPKHHAKCVDPKVTCTGRRFRILLDVSLYEKERLSALKIGDKIVVSCKQVSKNEFGEETHEMRQVFRIPLFVDDRCFTASITESEMLLIDAPFKEK